MLSLMLMMIQVVCKVTLEKPIRLSSAAIWVFVHRRAVRRRNKQQNYLNPHLKLPPHLDLSLDIAQILI